MPATCAPFGSHACRRRVAGLLAVVALLPLVGCQGPGVGREREVRAVIERQASDWNRGDIPAFMEGYWQSTELSMFSGGVARYGWMALLQHYQTHYPNKASMGTLTFDQLQVRPLGEQAALVLGRWKVSRTDGPIEGNFTLVFQRIDGRWVIVHDHTSVTPYAAK